MVEMAQLRALPRQPKYLEPMFDTAAVRKMQGSSAMPTLSMQPADRAEAWLKTNERRINRQLWRRQEVLKYLQAPMQIRRVALTAPASTT